MLKNKLLYNNFSDWRFDIKKAKDSFIWDQNGNKIIDFTSAWNVTNLGWNNSEITAAIIDQAKKNTYVPGWTADPIQNRLAEELTKSLPRELNIAIRATGGTEANEEAIKTARAFTGRRKILGFRDTYHGHSLAVTAIGYPREYSAWKAFGPIPGELIHIEYPNLYRTNKNPEERLADFAEGLELILKKKNVAAIVTEAGIITGWGSTYVAPKGFLKTIRKLATRYGTLIILDEVGTGFSRLGKLFGMQLEGAIPDIVTFAKGLSNGAAAIGAMVTTTEIAEKTWSKSNIYSTFGWTPIACAVVLKTLEIHKREKVWLKAERDGKYMMNVLQKELKNNPWVGDIRGIGMEIGIDFVKDKKTKEKNKETVEAVVKNAFKKRLHIVCDHESNIQLMPPLTIERKTLDDGLEILIETINSVS